MRNQLRLCLTVCSAFCLAVISQAQTLYPWALNAEAPRSDVQFLDVSEGVVLPKGEVEISLPGLNGEKLSVALKEQSVMPPELAARYPEIQTYRGKASDGSIVAITQTGKGLDVYVAPVASESWVIEPIGNGLARLGTTKNLSGDEQLVAPLSCGYNPDDELNALPTTQPEQPLAAKSVTKVETRKYILALACTGEFGNRYGGTKASVMATFATALNILNAVTYSEVGMLFELHPMNDTLIFTNPATDPYINSNNGGALLGENPIIINNRIPISEYDLGHVFTNACTDVGGVVSGNACNAQGKARGVTCHYTSLSRIVEDVMAHEVAHQFAVSHSWNNCPGNDGQRAGQGAFEPGSGSTIMSYQGACGAVNNVSNISAPVYYHIGSIQQFVNFTTGNGGGALCADFNTSTNDYPVIDWPYTNGFAIPKSTPFVLSATASDPNGDPILYNWEQYDLGPATALCSPRAGAPLFRSVPPAADGNTRYFPDLQSVRTDDFNCEEIFASYGRELNFRMTVRDKSTEGGGTVWEQVTFDVAEDAGPFVVTSQSTLATTYVAGSFITVEWDVANTNVAPVNCQSVNIYLSMDNGITYPYTLASGTVNDGSEGVTLPIVDGSRARIKVEAADNIFYALSPSRFTIVEPTEPGFTFVPSETTSFLCLPEVSEISLFTSPLLGYDSTLTVRIVNSLPAGVVATLDKNTLLPGEEAMLTVDFAAFNQTDSVIIILEATGPNVDTARRELLFDVVSNDFSDLQLQGPLNGEVGLSGLPVFTFTPSTRATEHIIEVSDDPLFGLGSLVIQNPDPTGETLGTLLEPNSVYFWRVIPQNRCGIDYDVPVNAFHTYAASCERFAQDDVILIPPRIRTTVEAIIPVAKSGAVNDLNLPLVNILHADINDIRVKLISPSGTSVVLVENRCGGTNRLITGFDDDSPLAFSCSPLPNDGLVRRPINPLGAFNGENINGDWRLQVEVLNPSNDGGEFRAFDIQFCANVVSQAPSLEIDLVTVPTGQYQNLDRSFLRASDPDNSSFDLEYIIVTNPSRGHIERYGVTMSVGDRFNQGDVDQGKVVYVDDLGTPGSDEMTVVLTDNSGNLIATPTIEFDIQNNYSVSAKDESLRSVDMSIAPNPTTAGSTVRWQIPSAGGDLMILDLQGRIVTTQNVAIGQREAFVDTNALAKGMYVVHYRGKDGITSIRLVVQ